MKPASAEMAANLAWFTQGLGFPESYRPGSIRPFIWEVAEKGELTAEQLMLSNIIWGNKSLKLIQINNLSKPSWDPVQSLLRILSSNLTELNIYEAYFPDHGFDIYIGKTQDNDWFGLCSQLDTNRNSYVDRSQKTDTSSPSGAALHLVDTIEKAGFPLARGYKYEKWMWEVAETRKQIIEKLLTSIGFFKVQQFQGIQHLASNFVYPPKKYYRELDEFLQSTLTNLRVYIIGASDSEFNIYVLGNTQDGDWAGVLVDVELNP